MVDIKVNIDVNDQEAVAAFRAVDKAQKDLINSNKQLESVINESAKAVNELIIAEDNAAKASLEVSKALKAYEAAVDSASKGSKQAADSIDDLALNLTVAKIDAMKADKALANLANSNKRLDNSLAKSSTSIKDTADKLRDFREKANNSSTGLSELKGFTDFSAEGMLSLANNLGGAGGGVQVLTGAVGNLGKSLLTLAANPVVLAIAAVAGLVMIAGSLISEGNEFVATSKKFATQLQSMGVSAQDARQQLATLTGVATALGGVEFDDLAEGLNGLQGLGGKILTPAESEEIARGLSTFGAEISSVVGSFTDYDAAVSKLKETNGAFVNSAGLLEVQIGGVTRVFAANAVGANEAWQAELRFRAASIELTDTQKEVAESTKLRTLATAELATSFKPVADAIEIAVNKSVVLFLFLSNEVGKVGSFISNAFNSVLDIFNSVDKSISIFGFSLSEIGSKVIDFFRSVTPLVVYYETIFGYVADGVKETEKALQSQQKTQRTVNAESVKAAATVLGLAEATVEAQAAANATLEDIIRSSGKKTQADIDLAKAKIQTLTNTAKDKKRIEEESVKKAAEAAEKQAEIDKTSAENTLKIQQEISNAKIRSAEELAVTQVNQARMAALEEVKAGKNAANERIAINEKAELEITKIREEAANKRAANELAVELKNSQQSVQIELDNIQRLEDAGEISAVQVFDQRQALQQQLLETELDNIAKQQELVNKNNALSAEDKVTELQNLTDKQTEILNKQRAIELAAAKGRTNAIKSDIQKLSEASQEADQALKDVQDGFADFENNRGELSLFNFGKTRQEADKVFDALKKRRAQLEADQVKILDIPNAKERDKALADNQKALKKNDDEIKKQQEKNSKDAIETAKKTIDTISSVSQEAQQLIGDFFAAQEEEQLKRIESRRKALDEQEADIEKEIENQKELADSTTGNAKRSAQANIAAEKLKAQKISEERKRLDAEQKEIERQAFERNKAFQIVNTIMNGASAIIGALSSSAPIDPTGTLGAIRAVIIAAATAAQLATINSQQFALGTNMVTGGEPNKDSVNAWLMPGEAVIPKKANLANQDIIKALVSNDQNKIDKALLENASLVYSVSTPIADNSGIEKRLDRLESAILSIPTSKVTVNADIDGFSMNVQRSIKREEFNRRKR